MGHTSSEVLRAGPPYLDILSLQENLCAAWDDVLEQAVPESI
jgi:hypothetical protein